jgi:hypothetical protein
MAVVSSCREALGSLPERAKPSSSVAPARRSERLVGALRRDRRPPARESRRAGGLEEGGDDVKSAWPGCPGLHTRYSGRYKGMPTREGEPIPKSRPRFRLQAATRLHEGGAASNRRSACGGEYVLGPCTSCTPHPGLRPPPEPPRGVRWRPPTGAKAQQGSRSGSCGSHPRHTTARHTGSHRELLCLLGRAGSAIDADRIAPFHPNTEYLRNPGPAEMKDTEERAHGECLGARGRGRTWLAAKSPGELPASGDPGISEWGNLPGVMPGRPPVCRAGGRELGELNHLSTPRTRNQRRLRQ